MMVGAVVRQGEGLGPIMVVCVNGVIEMDTERQLTNAHNGPDNDLGLSEEGMTYTCYPFAVSTL